ncbi:MAG: non-ribosomal peptide synthetase [Alphaproteobacteria bacterium]|nr:non-ribosomal peptide synthetase [Alphaproteobacteria bacterium]
MMLFIERFIDIADQYPENIAIQTDGRNNVSYVELKNQAFSVAQFLQEQHIKQGDLVAIGVRKSAEYISAMLGCWLIGAAFMPLDPELPPDRRDFILNEASPKYILDAQNIAEALNQTDISTKLTSYEPENLAYVIFTSGSTGKPKGVMVSHLGLVNCLAAQIKTFRYTAQSRALFYLSTNFDASISDMGTALLSGAALLIETGNVIENAAKLPEILHVRKVTHMDIPPSLLRLMRPEQMPESLDTIVIGGEVCPPQTVVEWASYYNLVNVYGPTEATICTSMVQCDPNNWTLPLIGKPLPNVEYILVNDNEQIIEGSGTGELLIGGLQLAIGYMNRPELNAQKFINIDGNRFYRTGDLITRHENNDLEFLGRTDRQVKIRGQLVELEEIEARLSEHPLIARAAVIKRDMAGRGVLAGFIENKERAQLSAEALKFWLRATLPSWMIPQYFVFLDKMPKTSTGKIDYAMLKKHNLKAPETSAYFAPQTPWETKIQNLWQKVLKTNINSVQKNFFTLGGDSMAVLELSLEAELIGLPLTTTIITEFPTIKAQAEWVSQNLDNDNLDAGGIAASVLRRDIAFDHTWEDLLEAAKTLPKAPTSMQNILFTGATGFLGALLLYNLVHYTNAQFTVLIRADNAEEGQKRLIEALQKHERSYNTDELARITVICGDFAQPLLGLKQDKWDELSQNIDTVFHIGALVNTVAPYQSLRAPNVSATQEIVKFALNKQRKPIHYASTLSVFVSTDQNEGTVYEQDTLENTKTVYGGYGQTKWAAEKFLLNLPSDLCELYIYRLGLITGSTETGVLANHDFLYMFIKGIANIGAIAEGYNPNISVDVTPVNYAANIMFEIAQNQKPNTYHIANNNGLKLQNIIEGIRKYGQELSVVPNTDWYSLIENMKHKTTGQEAATFLGLCRLFDRKSYQKHRAMDLFQATNIQFDTTNTKHASKSLNEMHKLSLNDLIQCYVKTVLLQIKTKPTI